LEKYGWATRETAGYSELACVSLKPIRNVTHVLVFGPVWMLHNLPEAAVFFKLINTNFTKFT
jgi:hypothetical protein